MARTALWQAVKMHQPHLTDEEVEDLLRRTAETERLLVVRHKMNLDQAREIVREELFPPLSDED